jgi:type I restriction enzyme S subunit
MSDSPTLNDVCTLIVDCEHKTAPEAAPGQEYGYSIGTPNIRNGRIDLNSAKRVDRSTFDAWTVRAIPQKNDIILTREAPAGEVGLVDGKVPVCLGQRTVLLRPDAESISPRYLHYKLLGPDAQELIASRSEGSTVAHLNVQDIRRMALGHLPKISVQEAIAATLGALDDKIAVNERIAETNHSLAQAYLAQWHESSDLTKLSEIANITMGSSPPGESYNEDGVGMPFYQGTRDFGDRFPGHRVWCTSPVRAAPEGSCLLSVRAPVGRVNIAREPCCIGRGVAAIQSKQDAPSVLFHELAAASNIWLPFESEGTVFGAINKQQLSNVKLRALDVKSARALEEILRPLDQRVASAYDENRTLASLRDTLLPKLMSGEIRVRDAEQVVEDVT